MRPPSPSIPEKDFFAGALRQGLRLDGRAPLEPRSPVLAFGAELGTVNVSLGKTRYATDPSTPMRLPLTRRSVLAHVQAHMVRPPPERPYEGVVSVHAELAPMAGAEYEAGR
jgi:exosome complex component RRP45